MALRSVVMGQQAVISQLQAADRKSQVVTLEMLQADYQRQVQLTKALEWLKGLQTQMAKFQRQLGPAKGPAQPDAPGEAVTQYRSFVRTLKKMMTDKYCPRGEIKKLEFEMWNLKVKGTDVVTYSQRFQEWTLMSISDVTGRNSQADNKRKSDDIRQEKTRINKLNRDKAMVELYAAALDDGALLVKRCGYFFLNWSSRSHVNSGPLLEFHRTLTNGIRSSDALSYTWESLGISKARVAEAIAIAIACFTHNRSNVNTQYNKTPYELIRGPKPNIQYFHVFGSLCYPTNDHDDLGKMKPKADIVLNENANEFVQENIADFNGNVFYNAPPTPMFEEAKSYLTYQDLSNMHEFHQKHRSSDMWTKNHPIEQVIGDPSKPVMTRNRLQTDAEVCMYALTDSGFELIAYSDADLVGCNDDCKSTFGGIQFLGDKLVNWSSKKQDYTAMSTTEAEYISLSACYILHLPVETPNNPFLAPVNIETIEAFMNKVRYQGVVDKVSAFYTKNLAQPWQTMFKVFNRCLATRTFGHDQTKINILQQFHVVINQINVDYAALLWWDFMNNVRQKKEVIEDVRVQGMLILDAFLTAKIRATADFKEYETVFMTVVVPMNHPQPVVSTQVMHRSIPRTHMTPTLIASPQGKKRKQSAGESKPESHKDKPEYVDDDDDKDDKKVDEEKRGEMGSLETRTEKMQTPISTPPRSPRTILSSDKNITHELTKIVPLPTTTKSNTQHSKRRISTIIEDRDAFRLEVPDLVSQEFNAQAPKIIEEIFKNYVQSNVIQVHPTTITSTETSSSADLQQQLYFKMKKVFKIKLMIQHCGGVLKHKFEKSSTSNTSCRDDAIHSHHDDHQEDDAPPKGRKE
ncbi:hypothetical protein Tco_1284862 [Tanacetum coccineum]